MLMHNARTWRMYEKGPIIKSSSLIPLLLFWILWRELEESHLGLREGEGRGGNESGVSMSGSLGAKTRAGGGPWVPAACSWVPAPQGAPFLTAEQNRIDSSPSRASSPIPIQRQTQNPIVTNIGADAGSSELDLLFPACKPQLQIVRFNARQYFIYIYQIFAEYY
jgi:hypothetical protein